MSQARELADVASGNTTERILAGRKNLIINGGFDVWQRGTSFTGNSFTADRFVSNQGNVARSVTVPESKGFKYSAQYSGTFADPFIQQVVEGSQAVAGRIATFSFWLNGTLEDIEDGYIYDGVYTSISSIGVSLIETVGTWNRYSATHTFASGDYNPIVRLDFAGDTATTIQTTGWQLELGSQATDFEYRSYGEELALCQRYYEVLDASSSFVTNISSSHSGRQRIPFTVEKRSDPTISFGFNSVSNFQYYGNGCSGVGGAATKRYAGITYIGFNNWSLAVGGCVYVSITNTGSNDIYADAEL